MDIQRQAFEEAFKQTDYYIAHGDLSTLMLCDDQYALDDVQVAFEMWQAAKAQAVPEGFVLVPKTPDVNIVNKICTEFIIGEDLNGNPVGLEPCDAEDVLEIIVKALEPAND